MRARRPLVMSSGKGPSSKCAFAVPFESGWCDTARSGAYVRGDSQCETFGWKRPD